MDEPTKATKQLEPEEKRRPSPPSPEDLKKMEMIAEAISDEIKYVAHFESLMHGAKSPDDREIIRQIRMDDKKHIQILSELLTEISGNAPSTAPPDLPSSHSILTDYERMIFSKLEAVEFYRKILFACSDQRLRDMLYEMITDEQNHATKFTYLYAKNIL